MWVLFHFLALHPFCGTFAHIACALAWELVLMLHVICVSSGSMEMVSRHSKLHGHTKHWKIICEPLLWPSTQHIMRMIRYARHDVSGFWLHLSRVPHCRTWCVQRCSCGYLLYGSLRIISCTLVHPHDAVCVRLLHSCG